MCTVYVLHSPSHKKIYVGHTFDIDGRLLSHNKLSKKGWTVKFRPWILVYTEQYATKTEAMRRERELKSAQGRKFIWDHVVKFQQGQAF